MNKTTLFLTVLVVVGVGAYLIWGPKKVAVTPPVVTPVTTVHYMCRNSSIDAVFSSATVSLTLSDGRKIVLPQTPSGSGMRYESGTVAFIGKGDNAFLEENSAVTYADCVINTGVPSTTPGIKTFSDQGNTLSFSYPSELSVSGGELGYTASWRVNTQTLGITIAKVAIPKETQPKTNFSEGTFSVGTSSDTKAINECLTATNGESLVGKETINSVLYTKFTLGDAGAGNYYNTTSYRTLRNNQCYAIEYTIHSTSLGAYSPEQGISAFDLQKVTTPLEAMVHSVTFSTK